MQLSAACLAVLPAAALGLAATASAQPAEEETVAEAAVRVYTDDDRVTVITPSVSARFAASPRISIEVDALADVISAASVDVTSQASPYAFDDLRVEGGTTATWAATPRTSLGASLIASQENDYRSLHLGFGLRTEVARRNGVIDLAYRAAIDEVGRRGDPAFARPRRAHRLAGTYTQVLDRNGYLDLVLDTEVVSGYQASPYRFVPIFDDAGALLYNLPEETPERRAGVAALARVRRAVGPTFVHADYRLYGDDWGVVSHTGSLRVAARISPRVTAIAQLRAYLQSAAVFHEERYVAIAGEAPAWRTRDRALGRMRSFTAGLGCEVAPRTAGGLRVVAAVAATRFVWLDYALQDGRDAILATLGLTVPF